MKVIDKQKKRLKDFERDATRLKEKLKQLAQSKNKMRKYDKEAMYKVPPKIGDYFMIERYQRLTTQN